MLQFFYHTKSSRFFYDSPKMNDIFSVTPSAIDKGKRESGLSMYPTNLAMIGIKTCDCHPFVLL